MLNVFITVDTEIWPFSAGWPVKAMPASKVDFSGELAGYLHGETPGGNFGVPYQLESLRRHGLKASYFVEALHAGRAGRAVLKEIVQVVQRGGQEVQLHLHTEWLREQQDPALPGDLRQHMRLYDEDHQAAVIARGLENLRQAGVPRVHAFRAGNYGANFSTLRALARNGIRYDTSHDACFLGAACDMNTERPLIQPREIEGVVEFPVSCFVDYPGHLRHAQLCACSFAELRAALLQAWRRGWYAFVIVLHGFELVRHVREPGRRVPDRINIRRFDRLCEFLGGNRDKFRTRHFSEIEAQSVPAIDERIPLDSRLHRTAWRMLEQLSSRLQ